MRYNLHDKKAYGLEITALKSHFEMFNNNLRICDFVEAFRNFENFRFMQHYLTGEFGRVT